MHTTWLIAVVIAVILAHIYNQRWHTSGRERDRRVVSSRQSSTKVESVQAIPSPTSIPSPSAPLNLGSVHTMRKKTRVFVTYGCDKFEKSKRRLMQEVEDTEMFDKCFVYDKEDALLLVNQCGNPETTKVLNMERGGGYWIWKPFVIQNALEKLTEGDILVYADAGCTLHNRPQLILRDMQNITKDGVGVSHCGTRGGHRNQLNRMDVMQAFTSNVGAFLEQNDGIEFEANRLLICKKETSVNFIQKWVEVACQHPMFFTDEESSVQNLSSFKDHRHDQSVYNLLAFKFDIEGNSCNIGGWLVADRRRE